MLLNVRRIRLERGLEQREAAKRLGISTALLSRVERGVQVPWPALRERLANFYATSDAELFCDIDSAQAFLRSRAGEAPES